MEDDDVIYIPEESFLSIRNGPYDEDDDAMAYVARLKAQLAQCRVNAPMPQTPPHPANQIQPNHSNQYNNPSRHQLPRQHGYHHVDRRHEGHRPPTYDHQRRYDFQRHHGPTVQQQVQRSRFQASGITGLLNKLSPRNSDLLIKKIIDASLTLGPETTVTAIIRHAIAQPIYLNLLIRAIDELCNSGNKVVILDVIQRHVLEHMQHPFLTDISSVENAGDAVYDAFCTRVKNVARLKSNVMFAVGCIRACLVEQSLHEYGRVVHENLLMAGCSADVEVMLDIIDTYRKASAPHADIRMKLAEWSKTEGAGALLTPRARFKIMDILA